MNSRMLWPLSRRVLTKSITFCLFLPSKLVSKPPSIYLDCAPPLRANGLTSDLSVIQELTAGKRRQDQID
jgi:hypothetical protein